MSFVVDANAIHAFQEERVAETEGIAVSAVSAILEKSHIALDKEEICYQEWIGCAGGKFPFALSDWVSDQLISGGIVLYGLAPNTCRKRLTQLGIPQKDHKWVRLAVGSGGFRLVTNDVDFFDPTKKKAPANVKAKIKDNRSGECAKALKKEYNVSVMCLNHVNDELSALET